MTALRQLHLSKENELNFKLISWFKDAGISNEQIFFDDKMKRQSYTTGYPSDADDEEIEGFTVSNVNLK